MNESLAVVWSMMGTCCGVERSLYKWKIEGLSTLLEPGKGDVVSGVFEAGGYYWLLHMMTTKSEDGKNYISLRLCIKYIPSESEVEAKYDLLIYDQKYGNHIKETGTSYFMTNSLVGEFHYMIPLETFKDPSSRFLINDSGIFGVEILKVTHTSKCYEECLSICKGIVPRVLHTWKIESLTNFPQPYISSEAFDAGGLKWYIRLAPLSGRETKYLSVSLTLDEWDALNLESGVFVEFSLSVKGQIKGGHRKYSAYGIFDSNSINWGSHDLLPYEDLIDPSEELHVEASVAVVGSLCSI